MRTIFTLDVIIYVLELWYQYLLWCIPLAVCTIALLAPMIIILARINLWLLGYIIKDGKAVKRTATKEKGKNNGTHNR